MKDKREEVILKTENLKREYKKQSDGNKKVFTVLKGLDLEVKRGEFIGIMGRSGCGKTTLLKILGLIDRPTSGTVYFQGRNTKELWQDELADIRRRELGFVFQDFYLMDSLSVEENIMLPMILKKSPVKEMQKKAKNLAEQFEIGKLLQKNPYELSGGQQQRVALASVLVLNPEILVIDEPTSQLDPEGTESIFKIIRKLKDAGKTVLLVEHKMDLLAEYADEMIIMENGKCIAFGPTKDVLTDMSLLEHNAQLPQLSLIFNELRSRDKDYGEIPLLYEDAIRVLKEG